MSFECQVCFESYTDHGTEHAPYSSPCGHIMVKSCLERLKEFGSRDEFNCLFCKKRIIFELCHPIYLSLNDENCQKINSLDFIDEFIKKEYEEMSRNSFCPSLPYDHGKMRRANAGKYFDPKAVVGDFISNNSETSAGNDAISLEGSTRFKHFWIH
uniref:RING-type domain-containing protein n=1 Tax=Strongyloides papillosus TaxID=174720 RepID=A0A0N5B1R9_STREA